MESDHTRAKMNSILSYLDQVEADLTTEDGDDDSGTAASSTASSSLAVAGPEASATFRSPTAAVGTATLNRPGSGRRGGGSGAASRLSNGPDSAVGKQRVGTSTRTSAAVAASPLTSSGATGSTRHVSLSPTSASSLFLAEDAGMSASSSSDSASTQSLLAAPGASSSSSSLATANFFDGIKQKMLSMKAQLEDKTETIRKLQELVESFKRSEAEIVARQTAKHNVDLAVQKKEFEGVIQRQLQFIDRLVADKEDLTKKTEQISTSMKNLDESWAARMDAQVGDGRGRCGARSCVYVCVWMYLCLLVALIDRGCRGIAFHSIRFNFLFLFDFPNFFFLYFRRPKRTRSNSRRNARLCSRTIGCGARSGSEPKPRKSRK